MVQNKVAPFLCTTVYKIGYCRA